MKEISVSDMKYLMLDIMSSIDEFCRQNGLRYSLAYGTLIGAVRHKGYIPWDDDIDIFMPRQDYLKLMKDFKHPYYKTYCAELNPEWDHFIAKVCDERTVIDEGHGDKCGVYVDVFPLDGWPEQPEQKKKHYAKVTKYLRLWSSLHYTQHLELSASNGLQKNLKIVASKVLGLFSTSRHFLDKMLKYKSMYNFEGASMVGSLTCGDWSVPRKYCEEFIDTDFEGRTYMISKYYDGLLRVYFGDYMQLPPEEERVSNHGFTAYLK